MVMQGSVPPFPARSLVCFMQNWYDWCPPTPWAHSIDIGTQHLRLLNQVVCQVLHHHIAVSCKNTTGSKRAECCGLQPASANPCTGTWHGTASYVLWLLVSAMYSPHRQDGLCLPCGTPSP